MNCSVHINLFEEDDKIVFSVFNQEDQIDIENIDKIWNHYFREEKKEYSVQGNIGMCLSIVRSVMKIHHGSCYAQNEKDGVTFYMKFNKYEENHNDSK